ncbi:bacterial low temperature requirement A protein-domain-containing protein [Echria macrotheca]|uniref:Bacterial low temperature requirement A protein-domain-containing protein n=1 Tax=Echria macrotheca TaxID=438768 RepID=A0AAJ0B9T2_9PEZI|nr:bacterial low temperature requirement A protein-domain-containing protein [Echria macrotheca]
MAPFLRRKAVHQDRSKRRIHTIVPWIQNPLQGVDKEHLVFAPRHEASTLELFFDLFFVANLATFTAYHAIVDHSSLFAYVGFFAIIWVTWFHTVLYDVRFENDSIYSRACKTVIMITFVGFALVGSSFAPGTDKGDNTDFRILCYTLVMSRVLFAIQYIVVGIFVGLARRNDLFLPIFLNTLVYVVAAGVYAGMITAFGRDKPVTSDNGIYSVWWIVMLLETVATITISSFWRMLSFKKTHLVERMGLLTLIVIGEGAIGVTKTISRMMGKSGLDPEGSALVLCIVLILIGTWMIYFDNHPHGHFGTIRQQIWSCLHFPIHLAIVGLVEGAQQVALARYVASGIGKLEKSFVQYCFKDHLDGEDLTDKLFKSIDYLQLDKKLQSLIFVDEIQQEAYVVGNTTGICGSDVVGKGIDDFPDALLHLYADTVAAMYSALGLSVPLNQDVLSIMFESWKLVYRYFWAAYLLLMVCFLVVMILIRTTKVDVFEYTALLNRGTVIFVAVVVLALSANENLMYTIIETPLILPLAVILMYLIIISDRFGSWIANRRNKKSGDELVGGSHGHGHGGDHSGHPQSSHSPESGHQEDDKHSAVSSSIPLQPHPEHRNSYNPLGGTMMPTYDYSDAPAYNYATPGPVVAPPQPAPQPLGFPLSTGYHSGGYVQVQNTQYHGNGY